MPGREPKPETVAVDTARGPASLWQRQPVSIRDSGDHRTSTKPGAESHVSERLDLRFEDVVWKVRGRGSDIFLCLLFEFQSTVHLGILMQR